MYEDLPQKIKDRILVNGDQCWVWKQKLNHDGYGRFKYQGRHPLVHRLVYELLVGEVSDGLELDHLCRNRACCNPKHLEPVTHAENIRRGDRFSMGKIQREKTHCKNGHEFNKKNTYWRKDIERGRVCRICRNNASYKAIGHPEYIKKI